VNGAGTTGATGRSTAGAAGRAGRVNANNNTSANGNNNRLNGNGNFNFSGISQNPFFNDPGVRQQLNLNDNQFNNLNRAYQTAYARYNQALNNLDANLTPQQREQQMLRLQNQFNTDLNQSVNSTFTDPQLRNRFGQLNRQFQGFNAFNEPGIQRQLNLTNEQRNQIRQLAAQWRTQLQQFSRGDGTDSGSVNITPEQWSQLSSQFYDQLNSILTPQQQQQWNQLTGQRYNFPASAYLRGMGNNTRAGVNGTGTRSIGTSTGTSIGDGTSGVVTPTGTPVATGAPTGDNSLTTGSNTNQANGDGGASTDVAGSSGTYGTGTGAVQLRGGNSGNRSGAGTNQSSGTQSSGSGTGTATNSGSTSGSSTTR